MAINERRNIDDKNTCPILMLHQKVCLFSNTEYLIHLLSFAFSNKKIKILTVKVNVHIDQNNLSLYAIQKNYNQF